MEYTLISELCTLLRHSYSAICHVLWNIITW